MTRRTRWLAGVRAGGVFGRALARFYQGKYAEAAHLFEKADELEPDSERIYFSHALRGRCHLELGQYKEALECLSRAYAPYWKQRASLSSSYAKREFVKFLSAFSDVLLKTGQVDRAEEVAQEAREYRKSAGVD